MPRVPYKKIKNKINYTVSTPRQQKRVTQRATSRHVISWGVSNVLRGVFDGIFILQGWNRKNLFYRGENRNSPILQGGKNVLTLNKTLKDNRFK